MSVNYEVFKSDPYTAIDYGRCLNYLDDVIAFVYKKHKSINVKTVTGQTRPITDYVNLKESINDIKLYFEKHVTEGGRVDVLALCAGIELITTLRDATISERVHSHQLDEKLKELTQEVCEYVLTKIF